MQRLTRRRLSFRYGLAGTFACFALLLALASVATAAPAWLSSTNLTEAGTPTNPDVAVDASGDATAVWDRSAGAYYEILAATRPAGGSWQTPVQISAPGETAGLPQVAVNPQGDAVAVWESGGPEHFTVSAASRSTANGAWSAPVKIGYAGWANPQPQVVVDSLGNAVAIWASQTENPGTGHIQTSTLPAGGAWSTPVAISGGSSADDPQLAVDPAGNVTAIWGNFDAIESAAKAAGASAWGEPATLSEQWTGAPKLAVNASGEVVAAWILALSNSERRIQGDVKPIGGPWAAPTNISEIEEVLGRPDIGIGPEGEAAAIWSTAGGSNANPVIQAAVKPSAGAWGGTAELSGTGQPESNPQLAFDPHGDALAVWWGLDAGNEVIESSSLPSGNSGWQAPVALSGSVQYMSQPKLAVDGQGNAVAVWEDAEARVIQTAGYDGAGPQLRELMAPTNGVVGQPVSFSVSPLDAWSALGATSWSFGDGTAGTGVNVTHVYSAAGSYKVTLTSSDALGNTTSASDTITITPPAHTGVLPSVTPSITALAQSHHRWRVGSKRAYEARTSKPPIGTVFSIGLNEQAQVALTFIEAVGGHSVDGKCVATTTQNRQRPPCKRKVTRAALTLIGHAGENKLVFQGRISRSRRLAPGQYTLLATAINAAGQRSPIRSLSFAIVK